MCLARNGAYGFGAVDENVFAAVCQNGLGVAKGTLSGMLIADLAAGHDNPLVSNMLAGAVPSKFPPEFITTPAARLTISFREWMAGKNL